MARTFSQDRDTRVETTEGEDEGEGENEDEDEDKNEAGDGSDTKAEIDDVAVLDDVGLAFKAVLAGLARFGH